jgi:hypothetical protein
LPPARPRSTRMGRTGDATTTPPDQSAKALGPGGCRRRAPQVQRRDWGLA